MVHELVKLHLMERAIVILYYRMQLNVLTFQIVVYVS